MNVPPGDSTGLLTMILQWAWAGVAALGAFVFKGVKEEIQMKADKSHLDTIFQGLEERKRVEERLFDKIEEVSDKTTVQFTQVAKQISDSHIELLNAIHKKK